ncbi:hypothetical protein MAR_019617 [Mya arenaria]|uniref:Ig-like domain-containing protein n=1 Tax=Mya arenaria TaxID=6604 RepID=A0ABY7E2M1_MYAAR|nr:hypothetical protein MAR_019617 [Mya arenaria]
MDINGYSFSCSESELTWTILNVSRYQHGQIWSCTFTTTKGMSAQAELALKLQECFELLVKQVPSPAYEHDHVTLSASYSGFEETEHPTRVVWGIISPLQSVGRILLPGCTVFGPIDISAYNFTCSEGELTWTIFNVSRSQQGQIWSCMLATNVNSVQAELALKLHDPLMPTLEVSPETVQEYHSVTLMCTIYDQVIPVSWAINGQHTGIWIGVYLGNCTTSPEVLPSDYNCTCISAKMYSCTIKNVTRAQHGDKWKCLANNAKGITMQSGDVEVKVLVGVSAVQLTKPTEIEVIEAEHFRVLFECVSEGLPAPTIRWFMDNKTPNNTDDDVELKLNSSSIIRETKQNADNTYRVKSQLDFTIDRKFDGMEIYCTTNNTARVLISTRRPVIRVQCNSKKNSHADMSLASKTMKDTIIAFGIQTGTLEEGHMNPSNESLTLETTHRVKDSTPDINVTCTYTGNRTVYVVSWYRNRALVGAVNPSCAILIRPHFDRYQFICPSPFETVLSVEKLILNQTVDKWTCQVGLGFGNVLESSPVDILLEATEGSDQLESNSETVKVVGGVIGGFVTGWLVGIASVFLVHKMRLIEKCMAEKETADIPTKLAAAHQKESLPNENEQEQDTNTNPSDYQNTMGTAGSDQTAGNTGPYESLQERNQEQYDIILQY